MDILQAVREDLSEILALQRIAFTCEAEDFTITALIRWFRRCVN